MTNMLGLLNKQISGYHLGIYSLQIWSKVTDNVCWGYFSGFCFSLSLYSVSNQDQHTTQLTTIHTIVCDVYIPKESYTEIPSPQIIVLG